MTPWIPERVLVVSNDSPDYFTDGLADGFLRWLGPQRVRVHLRIERSRHHLCFKQLWPLYDWMEQATWNWEPEQADLVVLSCRNLEATQPPVTIVPNVPCAVIDGHDHPELLLGYPAHTLLFKAQLPKTVTYEGTRIRPFPCMVFPTYDPGGLLWPTRTIRAFFSGTNSNKSRGPIVDLLRNRPGCVGMLDTPMPSDGYVVMLKNAQVGVSCRGAYSDAYRYWEVPYYGALLLSERPLHHIQDDFVEGREALFFSSVEECQEKLDWVMQHQEEASTIARAGFHKVYMNHLTVHRAQYVVREIGAVWPSSS